MYGTLINEGSPEDSQSVQLGTKGRRWIRNVRMPEFLPERMQEAERIWKIKHPHIITRSLSATYNCFGMTFATRRTAITSPEELDLIFRDDGFRRIQNRAEIMVGDVIVYRKGPNEEILHTGIIIGVEPRLIDAEISFTVLSQWGRDGEYIHKENDVPAQYGSFREYFTERRMI